MSYKWSNNIKLDALKVDGKDNVLTFKTSIENAVVYIEGNDISKVVLNSDGKSFEINNNEVLPVVVGEGNTRRYVFHYLKPGGRAKYLRLGITKHIAEGTWSSLPHPFELNTEPGFEEVFFHLLEGGTRSAIQVGRGVWFDNNKVDDIWKVQDHQWSTIPMGYHPVVGEPDVRVSYIWAYLAKKREWEKI